MASWFFVMMFSSVYVRVVSDRFIKVLMTGFEPGPLVSEATTLPTVPPSQFKLRRVIFKMRLVLNKIYGEMSCKNDLKCPENCGKITTYSLETYHSVIIKPS